MTLYAIGLILPDEIETELELLRGEFRDYMVFLNIPHITLAYRFEIKTDANQLIEKLGSIAKKTHRFTLIFDKVAYFQQDVNTAYVAIRNMQPVKDLHYKIYDSIHELLAEGYEGSFRKGDYTPHLTIGTEIPDDIFTALKKKLDNDKIQLNTEISSFSLYADGKEISMFELS